MSFVDNLGAFLDKTGVEQAPLAWFLAGVPWESDAHRNAFIATLDGQS